MVAMSSATVLSSVTILCAFTLADANVNGEAYCENGAVSVEECERSSCCHYNPDGLGKCWSSISSRTCYDVAPSLTVYFAETYPDSECYGSPSYNYFFKKATGLLDCYVYTDITGEHILGGSFAVTCLGDRATFNEFDRANCTGSIVAWGTTPWAWYTSNTCSSFEYDHQVSGTSILLNRSLTGQVLTSSDYPSTCTNTTQDVCEDDDALFAASANRVNASCSVAAALGLCVFADISHVCCKSCSATPPTGEAYCENGAVSVQECKRSSCCHYNPDGPGKCWSSISSTTCYDVAPSGTVYFAETYPDSECSGSPSNNFYFKKATGSLDCYVYTDATGEHIVGGSFAVTCLGDRATFNEFDRANCKGSIVAWGTTPWAWYTSNTCSSFEYDHQVSGTSILLNQSLVGQVLASSDYPSTCINTDCQDYDDVLGLFLAGITECSVAAALGHCADAEISHVCCETCSASSPTPEPTYPDGFSEASGVWAYCPAFMTLLLSVTGVLQ
ncbi:unnamed protein product [Prorocentrum cordatum]|uniref:PLAC domain-containing protein n=1 Tax=Prorocentrum cordatum TaxID=2364126 RepID=A0ABN9YCU8_9DINO|nr:unnamed protein product [Polarella glacialis]